MGIYSRIKAYPKRAWVVASFLAIALVLGGGEAKGPGTELVVQLFFAVGALLWIWLPRQNTVELSTDQRFSILIPLAILAVPAIQLVPLPPSIWHSLPGRSPEIDALGLVDAADAWRPISAVPLRTLATLLSMIPPLGLFYAVSRLDRHDRTVVPVTVLVLALVTALVGGLQIAAKDGSLSFYSTFHAGWVTGFQSNRNHAADLLLAGLLALALLANRSHASKRDRAPGALGNRALVAGGLGVLLAIALVMTGSRTGILLGFVALLAAITILLLPADPNGRFPLRAFMTGSAAAVGAAVIGAILLVGSGTRLSDVAARFADFESERSLVWADAAFAFGQFWPVGIGAGGFMAAMFPAERLEYLDASFPNQAHNDFLEIGIEAGIGGYLALVGVIVGIAALALRYWCADRRPEARAQIIFATGVLILFAMHSVVDYPLRSMSLACLAGAACGMLVRPAGRDDDRRRPAAN